MKSIFIVLAVGVVAAFFLAIPTSQADEVDSYRTANNSKQLNGTLCSPIVNRRAKNFTDEGVTCKCEGLVFFGKWNCKPSGNSTSTTTVAPTSTESTVSSTGNTEASTQSPSTAPTQATTVQ